MAKKQKPEKVFVLAVLNTEDGASIDSLTLFGPYGTREAAYDQADSVLSEAIEEASEKGTEWDDDREVDRRPGFHVFLGSTMEMNVIGLPSDDEDN